MASLAALAALATMLHYATEYSETRQLDSLWACLLFTLVAIIFILVAYRCEKRARARVNMYVQQPSTRGEPPPPHEEVKLSLRAVWTTVSRDEFLRENNPAV